MHHQQKKAASLAAVKNVPVKAKKPMPTATDRMRSMLTAIMPDGMQLRPAGEPASGVMKVASPPRPTPKMKGAAFDAAEDVALLSALDTGWDLPGAIDDGQRSPDTVRVQSSPVKPVLELVVDDDDELVVHVHEPETPFYQRLKRDLRMRRTYQYGTTASNREAG